MIYSCRLFWFCCNNLFSYFYSFYWSFFFSFKLGSSAPQKQNNKRQKKKFNKSVSSIKYVWYMLFYEHPPSMLDVNTRSDGHIDSNKYIFQICHKLIFIQWLMIIYYTHFLFSIFSPTSIIILFYFDFFFFQLHIIFYIYIYSIK